MTGYRGARDFIPPGADLERLRQAAAACRGCDLYRNATQTVFGRGDAHARVVLVGEQPGDMEDRKGLPFVGPAGHLLRRAVDDAGLGWTRPTSTSPTPSSTSSSRPPGRANGGDRKGVG